MVITALPDLAGALRAYLRSLTSLTDVVGDRVWIGWPRSPDGTLRVVVPPFVSAILIESGRGGGPEGDAPYLLERVDLSCLGPTEEAAHALWRQLDGYVVDPKRRRSSVIRAANTLITGIEHETGPYRMPDPPTGWPRTWASYLVRYCALPLSELG